MPQNTAQTNQPSENKVPQTPPSSPSLEQFVDQLIKEKNFPKDLDEAVKKQIKKDLMFRLNDYINAKLVAALPEKEVEEFEKLLEKKASQEEVQKFFQDKIPNLSTFLSQVFLDFRKTYLGIA